LGSVFICRSYWHGFNRLVEGVYMSEDMTWFDKPIDYPHGARVSVPSVVRVFCDPGTNGCIGELWPGQRVPDVTKMPPTESEVFELLAGIGRRANIEGYQVVATVEQVGGYVGREQSGSMMFNFGMGYGLIKGVCMALGWRLELVPAQKWQKAVGAGNKATYEKKWKNHLKDIAARLYPQNKVTLWNADALLILEYATKGGKE
jgi:hypothetical protein